MMKRARLSLVALAMAALLSGCAGTGLSALPHGPAASLAPTTPTLATDLLIADDGARLPLRVTLPKGKVVATIVAVHGFNDYSNAFAEPAAAWAEHGIATYAYDQRGFGQAPERGYWAGAWRLDEDLAIASRLVAERHPGVPHYLLGESMGGAVVMTAAAGTAGADRPAADGLILSAPAVWGRDTMNLFERAALWTADALMPGMTLTGGGLHIAASDNIAMLRALGRDPLVIKATRVDTLKGLVDLMDLAQASAAYVYQPTLALYGARDEIIPPEPMKLMVAALPQATSRIAYYHDGYHMLLRDLEAPLVLRDIESWIADRAAPLPSGADKSQRMLAGR
jgi:acylglycerol lipase